MSRSKVPIYSGKRGQGDTRPSPMPVPPRTRRRILVRRITPVYVACTLIVGGMLSIEAAASVSSIFARPKSSSFTVPSGVTLMFSGFRSR